MAKDPLGNISLGEYTGEVDGYHYVSFYNGYTGRFKSKDHIQFTTPTKTDVINSYKNQDKFIVIQWPEVQNYMDIEGFNEHSCLITDDFFYSKYGDSAYFVDIDWLIKNT